MVSTGSRTAERKGWGAAGISASRFCACREKRRGSSPCIITLRVMEMVGRRVPLGVFAQVPLLMRPSVKGPLFFYVDVWLVSGGGSSPRLYRLRFLGLGIRMITSGPRMAGNLGGGMEGQKTAVNAVASFSSVPFIAARNVDTISVAAS